MQDRERAQKLWDDLRVTAKRTDDLLLEIIETKAWLPLGYPTLAKAWTDLMGDYTLLTSSARTAVTLQMIDDDDVIAIRGLNAARLEHWQTLLAHGAKREDLGTIRENLTYHDPDLDLSTPTEKDFYYRDHTGYSWNKADRERVNKQRQQWHNDPRSSYHRKAHQASMPSGASSVHVTLGVDVYERYRQIAAATNSTVHAEATRAIHAHFSRLEEQSTLTI